MRREPTEYFLNYISNRKKAVATSTIHNTKIEIWLVPLGISDKLGTIPEKRKPALLKKASKVIDW